MKSLLTVILTFLLMSLSSWGIESDEAIQAFDDLYKNIEQEIIFIDDKREKVHQLAEENLNAKAVLLTEIAEYYKRAGEYCSNTINKVSPANTEEGIAIMQRDIRFFQSKEAEFRQHANHIIAAIEYKDTMDFWYTYLYCMQF